MLWRVTTSLTCAVVHDGTELVAAKGEGAAAAAGGAQGVGGLVLELELRLDFGGVRGRGAGVFQPRADVAIGELGTVADAGAEDGGLGELAIGRHDEFDDHGGALFALDQGSQIEGEALRQHGKGVDAGVDGGGFVGGVAIDGRALGDGGIDVGHADAHANAAVGAFGPLDLVEVAGIVVVDGRPGQGSEIGVVAGDGRVALGLKGFDLAQDVRGKLRLEAAFDHLPPRNGYKIHG